MVLVAFMNEKPRSGSTDTSRLVAVVQQKHVHRKRGASAALVHTKYPTLCQIEYGLDGKVRASSHELLLSIEKVRAPRRMLRPELFDFLTGQAEGSDNGSRVLLK